MQQLLSMRSRRFRRRRSRSMPHLQQIADRRAWPAAGGGGRLLPAPAWPGPAVCKRSIMSRAVTFILNLIYIFLLPLPLPHAVSLSLSVYPSLLFGLCFWAGSSSSSSSNSMAIVARHRRRRLCCCCRCAAAGDLSGLSLQFLLPLPFAFC